MLRRTASDDLGHEEGDRLLTLVAGRLTEEIRETDTVARFGGDEFVLVLSETTVQQAVQMTERIKDAVTRDFPEKYRSVTASYGISTFDPDDPTRQVDIVITYDLRGKDRVRIATVDGPVHVLTRAHLIEMKRASGRPQDVEDADALERLS